MKILVDADACPVKDIIEKIAKQNNIQVVMFIDANHILNSDYSKIITVSAGRDSVDFALANQTGKSDIVVTQDYGLSALILAKGGYPITQNGLVICDENLGMQLENRHHSAKTRRSGGRTKGPKKRTNDMNIEFKRNLSELILKICQKPLK